MTQIIGIGETVLDIVFKNDQVQKAVPGGSTFNAMISLGRSLAVAQETTPTANSPQPIAHCIMATEVGDDHVGDIITAFLHDNGVSTDYVFRHKGTKSHLSLAFLNERNDASYAFYKMHGDLEMPMNIPKINAGDIVLFGSFFAVNPKLRKYVTTFLAKAHEANAIIYYDINFRAAHLKDLPEVMPYINDNIRISDIVRGSAEDFNVLFGTESAEEAYQRLNKQEGIFIYTDAEKPIQAFVSNRKVSFSVKQVKTISTIGAGDNFNAGFCYGLVTEEISSPQELSQISEDKLSKVITYGQQFSSEVCQSLDNYISRK